MKLYRLYRRQRLKVTPGDAWGFFADPRNLERITPPWLGFEILGGADEPMYAGQIISYRIKPLPFLRLGWVTEITQVDEPRFFVDQQRLGPYRLWHHQHRFTAVDGGMEMEDTVHYALPGGPLGRLAHRMDIERRLRAIFDFRWQAVERRFGALA